MNLVKLTDFNLVSFICQALDQKCKNKQDMVPALKEKYTFYKKKKIAQLGQNLLVGTINYIATTDKRKSISHDS